MIGRILLAVSVVILLISSYTPLVYSSNGVGVHDDFPHARVVVTEVVDGDTVHISPPVRVSGDYRSVVRLADINASEVGTSEGDSAKEALVNKLGQYGGVIYLDIDKARGVDDDGRVIAVVYVRENETHLLNINKWMVENGYASINDYTDNDFDPSKWTLYLNYEQAKEKLPEIARVVLANLPQGVNYGTSWGVKVAVTPNGEYIGVAFSEYNTYHLWVVILDKNGNIVRSVNLSHVAVQYGLVNVTNVYRGMLTIAANNSGFLVAWTQFNAIIGTGSPRARITQYTYIPIDSTRSIPYNTSINQFFYLYNGTYQYHPHATWYCYGSGNCYWIIVYHYNEKTYSYGIAPDLTTRIPSTGFNLNLSSRAPSSEPTGIAVGIDVLSGVFYDPATKKYIVVARNYTDSTRYDIEMWIGSVDVEGSTLVINRIPVDNREGDQGPSPTIYSSGTPAKYYSYNDAYPMHTALLASGGKALVVYNETASSIAYAVVDLSSGGVSRTTLFDYGESTTFYPWIAGGLGKWLLAYSARGFVNTTLVEVDGSNTGLLSIADRSSSYVRVAYDAGAGLFPVVYGVRDLVTSNYNVFLTLVGESDGGVEPFIIPVNTAGDGSKIPVNIVVLPGNSPGTVVVFTMEGNDLVAYYVSSSYPESQQPVPIPEPVAISLITAAGGGVLVTYLVKKVKSKK
ncbi:thermonuclease family protein [Thermosphaera sp.]